MQNTLPAALLVEPVIDNYGDWSDPHYDFVRCHVVKFKDADGWHEAYSGARSDVVTWLQERGYQQVSCTMRRHVLSGRYETVPYNT